MIVLKNLLLNMLLKNINIFHFLMFNLNNNTIYTRIWLFVTTASMPFSFTDLNIP
jgi:hypothetical protein